MRTRALRASLRSALIALLGGVAFDCAKLEPIAPNTCGNGVIEENEDCDSFPATCGAPSSGVRQCRLTCDRKAIGSCPTGWGCSVDGFCREATGTFEASARAPSSAGVLTLIAGDFDGDGRTDLVGGGPRNGRSTPRVHFYDSDTKPATPVPLQFPMASPVVTDFNHDGRDDLAFALNTPGLGGVGVVTGTTDRDFSPLFFPVVTKHATDVRFVAVPSDTNQALFFQTGSALITLEREAKGTFFRSISRSQIAGLDELEAPATMGPEQVVGPLVRGRIFNPLSLTPISACGDVVVPYNVGSVGHVAIIAPCAFIGAPPDVQFRWAATRPIKDQTLPTAITGHTTVADFDGDGFDEIMVTTAAGMYIATTSVTNGASGITLSPFFLLTNDEGKGGPTPLAIGDLDGDKALDAIVPSGAYLAIPSAGADGGAPDAGGYADTASLSPRLGVWADARIGKFNGDDLADLVAVSPEALEIEVFAGAGNGLFTRFSVSSNQPIRTLTTGDFDGDQIQDIAFLASARPLSSEESTEAELLIAYGKANGGPEPARVVGLFAHASGVVTIHDADSSSIDQLAVVEATKKTADALPSTSVTFVYNTGDRQSLSPLVFRDDAALIPTPPNRARLWFPTAIVAAPFTEPGGVDILAVAFGVTIRLDVRSQNVDDLYDLPFPTGVWFAKSMPSAIGGLDIFRESLRFVRETGINAIDDSRFTKGVVDTLLVSAHADIDSPPDDVSEVITMNRSGSTTTQLLVVRPAKIEPAKPPAVTLTDFALSGVDDDLKMMDVDDDGLPDAVVLTRGKGRDRLRAYRNDGRGLFDTTPLVVDIPSSAVEEEEEEDTSPVDFAQIITGARADGRPRRALAIVTKGRLLLATLGDDKTTFTTQELTANLGAQTSNRITSVAVGDFDGDGVQDLAIADAGTIRILRQLPKLE